MFSKGSLEIAHDCNGIVWISFYESREGAAPTMHTPRLIFWLFHFFFFSRNPFPPIF